MVFLGELSPPELLAREAVHAIHACFVDGHQTLADGSPFQRRGFGVIENGTTAEIEIVGIIGADLIEPLENSGVGIQSKNTLRIEASLRLVNFDTPRGEINVAVLFVNTGTRPYRPTPTRVLGAGDPELPSNGSRVRVQTQGTVHLSNRSNINLSVKGSTGTVDSNGPGFVRIHMHTLGPDLFSRRSIQAVHDCRGISKIESPFIVLGTPSHCRSPALTPGGR